MGKGDIKTRRGKIANKSFGKHRLHKKDHTDKAGKTSKESQSQTETRKSA